MGGLQKQAERGQQLTDPERRETIVLLQQIVQRDAVSVAIGELAVALPFARKICIYLNHMADIVRANFPGIKVKYQPRDSLMPERGTLSVDKARRLLGYEPQFPLETGFVRYIDWYKGLAQRHPEYFGKA